VKTAAEPSRSCSWLQRRRRRFRRNFESVSSAFRMYQRRCRRLQDGGTHHARPQAPPDESRQVDDGSEDRAKSCPCSTSQRQAECTSDFRVVQAVSGDMTKSSRAYRKRRRSLAGSKRRRSLISASVARAAARRGLTSGIAISLTASLIWVVQLQSHPVVSTGSSA